jgi:hypothetical protein
MEKLLPPKRRYAHIITRTVTTHKALLFIIFMSLESLGVRIFVIFGKKIEGYAAFIQQKVEYVKYGIAD